MEDAKDSFYQVRKAHSCWFYIYSQELKYRPHKTFSADYLRTLYKLRVGAESVFFFFLFVNVALCMWAQLHVQHCIKPYYHWHHLALFPDGFPGLSFPSGINIVHQVIWINQQHANKWCDSPLATVAVMDMQQLFRVFPVNSLCHAVWSVYLLLHSCTRRSGLSDSSRLTLCLTKAQTLTGLWWKKRPTRFDGSKRTRRMWWKLQMPYTEQCWKCNNTISLW